jgi:integrase
MKASGSWDKRKYRWVKLIDGIRHRVTCGQLGLPEHLWTKEGSEKAAKEHFDRLAEQLIADKYAAHPELKLLAVASDKMKEQGTDTADLDEHLQQASRRPSGATREDTDLELRQRKALEDLLDVDLRHVPQLILSKLIEKEYRHVITPPDEIDKDRSLSHLIDVYLRQRMASEEKKLKRTTTIEFDRYNLKRFREFFGVGFTVDAINFESWHKWGEHCQSYAGGQWSNKTARSTLVGSRSFVNWLLKTERLARLPTNFDDYRIAKEVNEPTIFTDNELALILREADDELRMYVLLALNTGANQIDLAQLTYAKREKDQGLWNGKQIRRKRVKTQKQKNVPVVRYVLWDCTAKLIERFKAAGANVFRTSSGGLLVDRHRGGDGKYKNNDSLGIRFRRFAEKIGLPEGKTFKTLRATAASKLGNKKEYRIYGPLFLGQAPDGVYESHYLREDCKELNEGIAWLETALPMPSRAK